MFKVEVSKMKWNLFVKRILTCALAAATIATAVPAYAYAEEADDEVIVVEEEETEDLSLDSEEDAESVDAEIYDESLDNAAAENTVVVGVSSRLDDYASFGRGEGFTGEKVDGRDVVSANGFTFTVTDNDPTDNFVPFASLLSKILTPTSIDGDVYSYTVTAENIENANVYGKKGKEYRILRVGAADRILTLNGSSDVKSVVVKAIGENGKELNGPDDVYAEVDKFAFRSGNRIAIVGIGYNKTDHPNGGGFYRVTVGDKRLYGDPWLDVKDGLSLLIDLETVEDNADILVEEIGLKKDAITAKGDIGGDYDITAEVVSGRSGEYVTNSKEYDKAKVKLTVEDIGVLAYKITSMDATIQYGDKTQATTLVKDSHGIYCEIPSDILAEAAFLDKPSIVIIPKVEAEELTSISAKGFKYDQSKMANTATQAAGSTKDYQLSVTPKTCHLDGLDAIVTVGGDYADASVVKDAKGNHCLRVATFKGDTIANSQIWIRLVDKKNPDIFYGNPFVITPEVAKKLPAPTVKVIETTDMSAILSLAVPKSAAEYSNLWFVIEGKANVPKNKEIAEGMIEKIDPIYVSTDESSCFVRLLKDDSKGLGDGHAQKYDFDVKLVQGEINHPAVESPVKKISASTKEPAYETKLGLTKKKTSFINGEVAVTLATAKFGNKTTFRQLDRAQITDSNGKVIRSTAETEEEKRIDLDGNDIVLPYTYDITPGKYTLHVWPVSKDGNAKEATLALTVKRGIEQLEVVVPSLQISKKAKKAATLKAKVKYNEDDKTRVPAVKKVKWVLLDDKGNPLSEATSSPLYNKVTIKNGTVTVDKNLEITGNPDDYRFMIGVEADDYPEHNSFLQVTELIRIVSE